MSLYIIVVNFKRKCVCRKVPTTLFWFVLFMFKRLHIINLSRDLLYVNHFSTVLSYDFLWHFVLSLASGAVEESRLKNIVELLFNLRSKTAHEFPCI